MRKHPECITRGVHRMAEMQSVAVQLVSSRTARGCVIIVNVRKITCRLKVCSDSEFGASLWGAFFRETSLPSL